MALVRFFVCTRSLTMVFSLLSSISLSVCQRLLCFFTVVQCVSDWCVLLRCSSVCQWLLCVLAVVQYVSDCCVFLRCSSVCL